MYLREQQVSGNARRDPLPALSLQGTAGQLAYRAVRGSPEGTSVELLILLTMGIHLYSEQISI